MVKYLCKQGLSVNAVTLLGETPLHVAVPSISGRHIQREEGELNRYKVIAYLQKQGGDLDAMDIGGRTVRLLLSRWQEEGPEAKQLAGG